MATRQTFFEIMSLLDSIEGDIDFQADNLYDEYNNMLKENILYNYSEQTSIKSNLDKRHVEPLKLQDASFVQLDSKISVQNPQESFFEKFSRLADQYSKQLVRRPSPTFLRGHNKTPIGQLLKEENVDKKGLNILTENIDSKEDKSYLLTKSKKSPLKSLQITDGLERDISTIDSSIQISSVPTQIDPDADEAIYDGSQNNQDQIDDKFSLQNFQTTQIPEVNLENNRLDLEENISTIDTSISIPFEATRFQPDESIFSIDETTFLASKFNQDQTNEILPNQNFLATLSSKVNLDSQTQKHYNHLPDTSKRPEFMVQPISFLPEQIGIKTEKRNADYDFASDSLRLSVSKSLKPSQDLDFILFNSEQNVSLEEQVSRERFSYSLHKDKPLEILSDLNFLPEIQEHPKHTDKKLSYEDFTLDLNEPLKFHDFDLHKFGTEIQERIQSPELILTSNAKKKNSTMKLKRLKVKSKLNINKPKKKDVSTCVLSEVQNQQRTSTKSSSSFRDDMEYLQQPHPEPMVSNFNTIKVSTQSTKQKDCETVSADIQSKKSSARKRLRAKGTRRKHVSNVKNSQNIAGNQITSSIPENQELSDESVMEINRENHNLDRSIDPLPTEYRPAINRIDRIQETINDTAKQANENQIVFLDVESQGNMIKEQQQSLNDAMDQIKEVTRLRDKVKDLKNQQAQNSENDIEWAKLQAQIQSTQLSHDITLNQIQSNIAVTEIKAKNQFNLVKMQAEIESEKQKQKDWYIALENERERRFKMELQDNKHEQDTKMAILQKQFQQFQDSQKLEQESRLKERTEKFNVDMQAMKDNHAAFLETSKQQFARAMEQDRQQYEFNIMKIKEELSREKEERKHLADEISEVRQHTFQRQLERDKMNHTSEITRMKQEFSERLERNKEISEYELQERKQLFASELENKRLSSAALLAEQKGSMEKYKADLIAQVKSRQIDKQDENEKLKLQLKMDEFSLKLQDLSSKSSTNKYQFRIVPTQIGPFEFQMEKSAETAPHSVVRAFEQLWNIQFEKSVTETRIEKYKRDLDTSAKKAVENYSQFSTYLKNDLPQWILKARLAYCRIFQRPGTYIFKTGTSFDFTKHPMTLRQIQTVHQKLKDEKEAIQFAIPRYSLTEDGKHIVDLLEYMNKQIVFPCNAKYNVDWTFGEKISIKGQVITAPNIVSELFFGQPTLVDRRALESSVRETTSRQPPPKRSMPIYVSDNRVSLPVLSKKGMKQMTRIQLFA